MVPMMIMAQPAQPKQPAGDAPLDKDKKKHHGWSLFPKVEKTPPADMNVHNTSDRKRRFDIPGIFKSSSRSNLKEEFSILDNTNDGSLRSSASSVSSGRRRSMSFDQLAKLQQPAPAPTVPAKLPKPSQSLTSPTFPVRVSSSRDIQLERQGRRDLHEQHKYTESQNPRRQTQEIALRNQSPGGASVQSPTFSHDTRSGSPASFRTDTTTPLPALQHRGYDERDALEPLREEDLEPGSFDLVAPPSANVNKYSLEERSEQLFSAEHLQIIFDDPSLMLRFTAFLSEHRPASVPMVIYHLDAIKALRAIEYSNAVADDLDHIEGYEFTKRTPQPTSNADLKLKIEQSFNKLVIDDLPAYVTHVIIQMVSLSISRRVTGTLPVALREASEGLAEVFCLTDPSRPDNPIVFSSEEFHRTTQYGLDYVIGRNCRFLQGPKTNPYSVRRIREQLDAGKEHCEVFLNYRRDGSPFMNLLMMAPLCDSRGVIRYFIGAQVDVSGLIKECSDLESLRRLVEKTEETDEEKAQRTMDAPPKDEFQELSEMLNLGELDTVRRWGGRMHKELYEENDDPNTKGAENWNKPRLVINSLSPDRTKDLSRGLALSGQLSGIYKNYLLIRPYPSLRILFASPSLRVPGILQSPFMHKIGGSQRVRDELAQALSDGRGVTAKLRWISKQDPAGRSRWFHCTPLIGHNGQIGVWMIMIIDEEDANNNGLPRFRQPPPVDPKFGRHASSTVLYDGDEGSSLRSFAIGGEGTVGHGGAATESLKSRSSN